MLNWLTNKRIGRATFILWEIIPILLSLLLIFVLALLDLVDKIPNPLIISYVVILLIGHFILIQLRNNDIDPGIKSKLWKSGQGMILGGWSLYLIPSAKKDVTPLSSTKEIYFSDENKNFKFFFKNIYFYILFTALTTGIIWFIIH